MSHRSPLDDVRIELHHALAPYTHGGVSVSMAIEKLIDTKLEPLIERIEELSREVWKDGT